MHPSREPSPPLGRWALLLASIGLTCGCGARSDVDTTGPGDVDTTRSSCGGHHLAPDSEGGAPGCVIRASEVKGAELGPLVMTFREGDDVDNSLSGYWVGTLAIYGAIPAGAFRLWGDYIPRLCPGDALPLVPTSATPDGHVQLYWLLPSGQTWTSTSGTLDVIAYDAGAGLVDGNHVEYRPARFEVHGATMAPSPDEGPLGPGGATGTFTMDLTCRLDWSFAGL